VVTVPPPTALFINMPSNFSLSIGTTNFITVSGGVPLTGATPYVVNNNNSAVVQTTLSGAILSVRALSAGAATVAVSDSKGSLPVVPAILSQSLAVCPLVAEQPITELIAASQQWPVQASQGR
jgi:hypothetical protein